MVCWGFGVWVRGFAVLGFRFGVSSLGAGLGVLRFRVQGFEVSGSGFRGSKLLGSGFRCSGCWVLNWRFGVSQFGVWVFRVRGLWFGVSRSWVLSSVFRPGPRVLVVRGFPDVGFQGSCFWVRISGFTLAFRDRGFVVLGFGVGV